MSEQEYNIAVLTGDGIGTEVVGQATRVLGRAVELGGFRVKLTNTPWNSQHYIDEGHLTFDPQSELYVPNKTSQLYTSQNNGGLILPEEFIQDLRENYDAMLFGAIGDPKVQRGVVERAIIGGLRWHKDLDLYVNLRPVKLYSAETCPLKDVEKEDFDLIVVRENVEGLYTSKGEIKTDKKIRYAFEYARTYGRKTVTLVDKANVMNGDVGQIWRQAFNKVGAEYNEINTKAMYIDDAAAELAVNPSTFDVVVTSNLFGDILSDVASALTGAKGMAGSGNINPGNFSVFEPNHGTAPGLEPSQANPLGTILAVKLMLQHLGESKSAENLDLAIQLLFDDKTFNRSSFEAGEKKLTSSQITDLVLERM